MDEDLKKLKAIISDVLGLDPDEIRLDATFSEDLGADSLDLLEIFLGIEGEYDVTVDPETVENVKTVEEALNLIKRVREGA